MHFASPLLFGKFNQKRKRALPSSLSLADRRGRSRRINLFFFGKQATTKREKLPRSDYYACGPHTREDASAYQPTCYSAYFRSCLKPAGHRHAWQSIPPHRCAQGKKLLVFFFPFNFLWQFLSLVAPLHLAAVGVRPYFHSPLKKYMSCHNCTARVRSPQKKKQ